MLVESILFSEQRNLKIEEKTWKMHREGTYSHKEEVKGLKLNFGNEETKSSGHRSTMELVELIETVKSLRMEVKSYRASNGRLTRVQEEKNHVNT